LTEFSTICESKLKLLQSLKQQIAHVWRNVISGWRISFISTWETTF
jgi:hypothetical protein